MSGCGLDGFYALLLKKIGTGGSFYCRFAICLNGKQRIVLLFQLVFLIPAQVYEKQSFSGSMLVCRNDADPVTVDGGHFAPAIDMQALACFRPESLHFRQ